jgi:hypothetical protein
MENPRKNAESGVDMGVMVMEEERLVLLLAKVEILQRR